MNRKKMMRIIIDTLMLVLFVIQMGPHLEGYRIHEYMGMALFILFICHQILNSKWYTTLFHGKYTIFRFLWTIINVLLLVAMTGAMVSGIFLSTEIFGFLNLRSGLLGREIHMVATAWSYALMAMHLGLHLGTLLSHVNCREKIKCAIIVLLATISAYGLYAFYIRGLAKRMFLTVMYAVMDYSEPPLLFIVDYLSILVLFTLLAFLMQNVSKKCRKGMLISLGLPIFIFVIFAYQEKIMSYIEPIEHTQNEAEANNQNKVESIKEQQDHDEIISSPKTDGILIAYFSMSSFVPEGTDAVSGATPTIGNTETVANEIAELTGGDLFAIHTVKNYPISHSECSAIAEEEMKSKARPELSIHMDSIDDYDVIFIGYPIWWYAEPMAIRTFLEEYDFNGKIIVPFCTSLGVDVTESERNIQAMLPATTVLNGLSVRTGQSGTRSQVAEWLSKIGIAYNY